MGDLTEHFSEREFCCPCCKKLPKLTNLIYALELLRYRCKKPLVISSGYRCVPYNSLIGGAITSRHTMGTAADVMCPEGMNIFTFFEYALEIPVFKNGGIGVYHNRLHLDIRGTEARWYKMICL